MSGKEPGTVNTIQVEQAIFASSDRGSMKGYQLVARSPGIDAVVGQELCRWSPTKFPSHDPGKWTINYYPVNDDCVAVTRTVLGGPEYSGRGGTQVVTLILLLERPEFMAYGCNPIAVANHAMAMGALSLPLNFAYDPLPLATLPSEPIVDPLLCTMHERDADPLSDALSAQILQRLSQSQRVAVVGWPNPISAMGQLLSKLSAEQRWELCFTTGLSPTAVRPFQLHFLATADAACQRTLDAQNIVRIDAANPANRSVPSGSAIPDRSADESHSALPAPAVAVGPFS